MFPIHRRVLRSYGSCGYHPHPAGAPELTDTVRNNDNRDIILEMLMRIVMMTGVMVRMVVRILMMVITVMENDSDGDDK